MITEEKKRSSAPLPARKGVESGVEKLVVKGGHHLKGTVRVSGAKNAVLPIIAASVLGTEGSTILEVPELEDVSTICKVLECLGLKVDHSTPHALKIDSRRITGWEAPYDLVSTCVLLSWSWAPSWRGLDGPKSPNREAVPSGPGPSISI